ncbi:uncharacterized protein METZ01_LOCUS157716 [marine metagenome]|uniref:Uncharacterized protein n=1 Tax=marine metagenome TaxID=408172 RepID=A0A382AUV9_9ZZZZ
MLASNLKAYIYLARNVGRGIYNT